MGVLRTILIIVVFYYIFRFFNRYIMPFLVKGYINKNREQFQSHNQQQNKRKEGDVTIKYNKKADKKVMGDKGEYVDFEEIE